MVSKCTKCEKEIGGLFSSGDWEIHKGKKYCSNCLEQKGKKKIISKDKHTNDKYCRQCGVLKKGRYCHKCGTGAEEDIITTKMTPKLKQRRILEEQVKELKGGRILNTIIIVMLMTAGSLFALTIIGIPITLGCYAIGFWMMKKEEEKKQKIKEIEFQLAGM